MSATTYEMLASGEIQVDLPGGYQVFAKPLEGFPVGGVYMTWARGLIYLRKVERRDGAIEIKDVTLAAIRYSLARVRRAEASNVKADDDLRRRLRKARDAKPKAGAPTPERRKRGAVAREAIPNLEDEHGGPPNVIVHRAPDRLIAMHKRGTLTAGQLEQAERFHRAFVAGACDPGRAANLHRFPGAAGAGLPDAMLDAKHEVFAIYDHVGGRGCLGARVLMHIVGLDRTIEDCVREERGGDNWVNKHRVVGVLAAALDSVGGFYATRTHVESLRRRAVKGAEISVLSQGA